MGNSSSNVPSVGVESSSSSSAHVPNTGSSSPSVPIDQEWSSSSSSNTYQVFLSFRGEDVRRTFVDHLYTALDQRGIRTFKDDKRLQGGESISDELLRAIEESRTAIVVFSSNYAASGWCLDELEKIMECQEKNGLVVYPVFYDVEPSQVRRQTKTFGLGFSKAVKRNVGKEHSWKKTLQRAAGLSGCNVRTTFDGHESQCIKQIVEWFLSNPRNIAASFDENLIGIEPRARKLMSSLGRDCNDDVRMIGIWGMGGSGKTTVARVVFSEIKNHFDGASFIDRVRETSQKPGGLELLQEKILKNILMDKQLEVNSVHDGIEMLGRILVRKRVFIVLDDVDHVEQLRALAGRRNWFGKGSRILITTRDEQPLVAHRIMERHSVDLLTEDEAIQLFSRYAFEKCSPTEGYDELSLSVVRYAAGLPLTLKVLGSNLCGRGMAEWSSALARLKKIPEKETLKILKISFDDLEYFEKKIFLDIACFFKGWKKDEVVRILDSCEFYPDIGISVLEQKSLIAFSDDQSFQMHDLIQEMGREIVTQMHPDEPRKHSRLWRPEDISSVLQKSTGTEATEAIFLDRVYKFKYDNKAFSSMIKLRILYLRNSYNKAVGPEYLPNELRWLTWDNYAHKSLPENFQAPMLVQLRMRGSGILRLWKEKKPLDKLKFLDLRGSKQLIECPDFSGIPNLERLVLKACKSLIEVHPSIGELQRLVLLDLSDCTGLVDFPSSIRMKSLGILNFSGCEKLKRFPELLGSMDRLSSLILNNTAIEGLPLSISYLSNLVLIDLRQCENLRDLPNTVCKLKYLKTMDLHGCINLFKLPDNLGYIESLEKLWVRDTGIMLPPSSIVHLKNLKDFSLSGVGIDEHSMCLVADIGKLSLLEKLDLSWNSLAFLPSSISQLSRLKVLDLSMCIELKALPELPSSIAILTADGCRSLESIETLSGKCAWLWNVSLLDQVGMKGVGDILLPSMLQGHAVLNHRLNLRYTEKDSGMNIPKWFGQNQNEGNQFVLKLPPNRQNEIIGFAMCVVFDKIRLKGGTVAMKISLPQVVFEEPHSKEPPPLVDNTVHEVARSCITKDVWVGYLSLNMVRRSTVGDMPADWLDTATHLLLTFSPLDVFDQAELCAARVVYMEDVSTKATAVSPSLISTGSGALQVDLNFAAETTFPCDRDCRTSSGISISLDAPSYFA